MLEDRLSGYAAVAVEDSIAGWSDDTVRNELFAAAIEACPIGVSICDARAGTLPFVYVNSAFAGMTGYFPHDVNGRGLSLLHGPDSSAETIERIGATLAVNQPVDAELQLYRKDQTPFWCELRITPLSHQGQVVALICVFNDITERRARQFENHRRQKFQALGQLAGGVAHEINNLLQPILTFTELVQDEIRPTFASASQRLDRVMSCAEKARDIVRGILRYSRGDETATLSSHDLRAALTEALDFVRGLMPATVAITVTGLEAEAGSELGYGLINGVELTQVFSNLLTNAAQAMAGRGAVVIDARVRDLSFFRAYGLGLAAGRYCVVTVTDTGPGMNETVLAHLFDPFFTTKPVGQGTGLGLSVVYGILQNWQGAITVKSEPGQGAQFTLFIPQLGRAEA